MISQTCYITNRKLNPDFARACTRSHRRLNALGGRYSRARGLWRPSLGRPPDRLPTAKSDLRQTIGTARSCTGPTGRRALHGPAHTGTARRAAARTGAQRPVPARRPLARLPAGLRWRGLPSPGLPAARWRGLWRGRRRPLARRLYIPSANRSAGRRALARICTVSR